MRLPNEYRTRVRYVSVWYGTVTYATVTYATVQYATESYAIVLSDRLPYATVSYVDRQIDRHFYLTLVKNYVHRVKYIAIVSVGRPPSRPSRPLGT